MMFLAQDYGLPLGSGTSHSIGSNNLIIPAEVVLILAALGIALSFMVTLLLGVANARVEAAERRAEQAESRAQDLEDEVPDALEMIATIIYDSTMMARQYEASLVMLNDLKPESTGSPADDLDIKEISATDATASIDDLKPITKADFRADREAQPTARHIIHVKGIPMDVTETMLVECLEEVAGTISRRLIVQPKHGLDEYGAVVYFEKAESYLKATKMKGVFRVEALRWKVEQDVQIGGHTASAELKLASSSSGNIQDKRQENYTTNEVRILDQVETSSQTESQIPATSPVPDSKITPVDDTGSVDAAPSSPISLPANNHEDIEHENGFVAETAAEKMNEEEDEEEGQLDDEDDKDDENEEDEDDNPSVMAADKYCKAENLRFDRDTVVEPKTAEEEVAIDAGSNALTALLRARRRSRHNTKEELAESAAEQESVEKVAAGLLDASKGNEDGDSEEKVQQATAPSTPSTEVQPAAKAPETTNESGAGLDAATSANSVLPDGVETSTDVQLPALLQETGDEVRPETQRALATNPAKPTETLTSRQDEAPASTRASSLKHSGGATAFVPRSATQSYTSPLVAPSSGLGAAEQNPRQIDTTQPQRETPRPSTGIFASNFANLPGIDTSETVPATTNDDFQPPAGMHDPKAVPATSNTHFHPHAGTHTPIAVSAAADIITRTNTGIHAPKAEPTASSTSIPVPDTSVPQSSRRHQIAKGPKSYNHTTNQGSSTSGTNHGRRRKTSQWSKKSFRGTEYWQHNHNGDICWVKEPRCRVHDQTRTSTKPPCSPPPGFPGF